MPNPTMDSGTPGMVAANALNAASDNVKAALDKIPANASVDSLLKAAKAQTELAKAAALLEIGRQLQALSSIAAPGASIRYGLADVARALEANGGPIQ